MSSGPSPASGRAQRGGCSLPRLCGRCAARRGDQTNAVATGQPFPSAVLFGRSPFWSVYTSKRSWSMSPSPNHVSALRGSKETNEISFGGAAEPKKPETAEAKKPDADAAAAAEKKEAASAEAKPADAASEAKPVAPVAS